MPDALDPMALRQSANQSTEHRQPPFVVRMEPPFVVPMEGPQSSVDHTEYRGSDRGLRPGAANPIDVPDRAGDSLCSEWVVSVAAIIAVAVNTDGRRDIVG